MNKKLVTLAVSAAIALPGLVNAAQVAGDALEIYGKAHLSLDSVSAKDGSNNDVSNISMSSNSSRLGFKGELPVGEMKSFYKIESSISFDTDGKSELAHRAAYAGLKDGFGSVLFGYRDTVFKDLRGKFDLFGDTVGDARDILGSVNSSNLFDKRADNAIMYTTPKAGGVEVNVMYSTAWSGDTSAQAGQDNNNGSLLGANVIYKADALMVTAGMVKQKYVDTTTGETTHTGTGTRLVGTYDMGDLRIGLVFENLDDDKDANKNLRRSATGVNFAYKLSGEGKVKLQYIQAGDNDAVSDSGATQTVVGYDYKLDKNATTYVAYSAVSNDTNAAYLIGNGHDQKYSTATGEDVSAISAGYIISF
jgi:predicted porin